MPETLLEITARLHEVVWPSRYIPVTFPYPRGPVLATSPTAWDLDPQDVLVIMKCGLDGSAVMRTISACSKFPHGYFTYIGASTTPPSRRGIVVTALTGASHLSNNEIYGLMNQYGHPASIYLFHPSLTPRTRSSAPALADTPDYPDRALGMDFDPDPEPGSLSTPCTYCGRIHRREN